jgi:acetate kinase
MYGQKCAQLIFITSLKHIYLILFTMSSSSLRIILFKLDKCKKLCNDAKQHSNSKTIMMQFHKKSKSNNIHPKYQNITKSYKMFMSIWTQLQNNEYVSIKVVGGIIIKLVLLLTLHQSFLWIVKENTTLAHL